MVCGISQPAAVSASTECILYTLHVLGLLYMPLKTLLKWMESIYLSIYLSICLSIYLYIIYRHLLSLFLLSLAARTNLCLWIGAFSIPRDDKRYRGGEDAWFLDAMRNSFGVADGVSEWEDLAGINPQEYAQDLMKGTQEEIARIQEERRQIDANKKTKTPIPSLSSSSTTHPHHGVSPPPLTPADVAQEALTRAYHAARNFGSSTAIVGVLDGDTGVFGTLNPKP